MADMIPNSFFYNLGLGNIDLSTATIKCMLLTASHTQDPDTQSVIGDVSGNEASGTGYTAGGLTCTGVAWQQDNTNNLAKLTLNDPAWPSSTISAQYAAFYVDGATDYIIRIADFGSVISSTNDTFTADVDGTNGIIKMGNGTVV